MEKIPDFLRDAANVYRTRDYIVKQCITLGYDEIYGSYLSSRDTYYRRTRKRNRIYEEVFSVRKSVNGRRIHTSMYARTYID